ncbi:hypothetical protein FRC12_006259 [Ceratobasidium sp. 428]|nr:hypothetical protein FRC12_006259 [Ceratobasidium sp. 428]
MSTSDVQFKGYAFIDKNKWSDLKVTGITPKTWEEEDIDIAIAHCGSMPYIHRPTYRSTDYIYAIASVGPIYTPSLADGATSIISPWLLGEHSTKGYLFSAFHQV